MVEINSQLAPLLKELGRVSTNQERLYNSNGGPPGFLQTARTEDKGTFKMIFNTLEEHKNEIEPLKKWMENHEVLEEDRERRIKRYIAMWSLGAALFMAALAIWDHKEAIIHSLMEPAPHSLFAPSQLFHSQSTEPALSLERHSTESMVPPMRRY